MVRSVYQGDGYEAVSIPVTSSLASELQARASTLGIDVTELVLDLCIRALRADVEHTYPTFTVSDDWAEDFISDGFRVVARHGGQSTLCPFDALPFDAALSEFRDVNLTDDEIIKIARS